VRQLLKQEIIIRKLSKKNSFQHGINVWATKHEGCICVLLELSSTLVIIGIQQWVMTCFNFCHNMKMTPQINNVMEACSLVHYWSNNAITNMPMLFFLFWFSFLI
jgi:hypothetical protein